MTKNTQRTFLGKPTFLTICFSLTVSAYTDDQVTEFESIVVVGETTNTVITPEELERQQAYDLEDIFRSIPSVSVGGSLDMAQKVYIRGMEDTLLNVTVDGAPQTGTQFHHTGRISVEPELLKSVEVQQGAGEATSGAGAIAGAIRFETKDADDLLKPGQTFGGLLKGSYYSNEGYRVSSSLYGKLNKDWSILGSYVGSNQENFDDGDGDEVLGTASDQDLFFGKINGNISDNQKVSLSVEERNESGDFGQRANWFVAEDDLLFPLDRERQTIVLNHTYNPNDIVDLKTTIYQTETELVQNVHTFRGGDGWGNFGGTTKSTGLDIKNTSKFGKHKLTYGIDYREDKVTSRYLDEGAAAIWALDPNISSFREEGTVLGLYAQDHWQLTDKLLLSYGARYDKYDLDQVTYNNSTDSDGFSPNIGLSYDLNDKVKLTAGHARAIRGKEIGDAFTLEQDPSAISLDPNLDKETVNNTEIGIEINDDNRGIKASIYKTTVNDLIQDQLGRGTFYENIGKLESYGFELGGYYEWDKLRLDASFSHSDPTLNGNKVEGYEHIGIGNVRGNSFNLKTNYQISPQLEFGWNYTHVSGVNDIEVLQHSVELGWIDSTQKINKPGYDVHDLSLRWKPVSAKNLTVDFSIQNVFDEAYLDHSSVADYTGIPGWETVGGVNERGRDFRLSMQYKF